MSRRRNRSSKTDIDGGRPNILVVLGPVIAGPMFFAMVVSCVFVICKNIVKFRTPRDNVARSNLGMRKAAG